MSNTHICQELPTQIGNLTLVSTEVGLRAVLWPKDKDRVALPDQMTASTTDPIPVSYTHQTLPTLYSV